MKKWMCLVLSLMFVSLNAWAISSDEKAAQATIESWFAAMKNDDYTKAASLLSPQFVSVHTDRIVRDKAQEMELIKNLDMKSNQLTDFKFSRSGDAIVVTYNDATTEKIDNNPVASGAAGRMAVLQKQKEKGKNKDKWIILAYANMDPIK
jgi:hypothetical protein